ncbi:MAG: DUF937 domain-containing protein [Alphaproteobacteria bacterium]|nr:DUF937 domain-containing protein [Alphaproteobacteria bacterium]
MGLLDDVLGSAVPGGGLTKPLMVAATALLAAKATGGLGSFLGGGGTAAPTPSGGGQPQSGQPQGGLFGGLAGLVQQFQQSGHGDIINSWVGSEENRPITPEQLHQALGPEAVNNLSQLTGVASNDLIPELARVLPGIVDKLTPHGRIPDHAEMSRW